MSKYSQLTAGDLKGVFGFLLTPTKPEEERGAEARLLHVLPCLLVHGTTLLPMPDDPQQEERQAERGKARAMASATMAAQVQISSNAM